MNSDGVVRHPKEEDSSSFERKLAVYALVGGAALGLPVPSEAGPISYSGLQNITVNAPGNYGLDLNADSVVDFIFAALENTDTGYHAVRVYSGTNNAVANASKLKAQQLNFGDPIPNGLTWSNDGLKLAKRGGFGDKGNWSPDGTPGFLGVRFDISGQTHYGWVRVGVTFQSTSFRIVDWAYNTTSGEAIRAGEPIPEPSTLSLMALGAAGLLALRRRKQKSS